MRATPRRTWSGDLRWLGGELVGWLPRPRCWRASIALAGQADRRRPAANRFGQQHVSAIEGDAVSVRITLSAAAGADVTVKATTSGGSGYTGRDETVTIRRAGQTGGDFDVATDRERSRRARPQIHGRRSRDPNGATLGTATGTETITDDDATPTLAISGTQLHRGRGQRDCDLHVASRASPAGTVTVNYATANGTATAGQDYTQTSRPALTWPSGDTGNKSIVVPVKEDTLDEVRRDLHGQPLRRERRNITTRCRARRRSPTTTSRSLSPRSPTRP